MTKAIFGGPNVPSSNDWQFRSDSPTKIFSASSVSGVVPLVRKVEEEVAAGSFAVLLLSYEAAPAFDAALSVHESEDFPLAWAAIFPHSNSIVENVKGDFQASSWQPLVTPEQYNRAIGRIHELIVAGQTYQVNFTMPLVCNFAGSPEAWYRKLCQAQHAPYSVYLDLGRYKILSFSPELFFMRKGDRVTTRPMKGTARRGRWLAEDQEIANRLRHSEKDRAENVMIVDLLRNDLGKVAQVGTVRVSNLFELERYDTVWQMTSTIQATLPAQTGLVEILRALFPCGSITGAPKIRTMQIIRDLETTPRNVFTGTIGLIQPGGDCCFNVAIRTIVLDSESSKATFGVGGGITIDSTAAGEYDECLAKTAFLNRANPDFQLIETMLLDAGDFFLLDRHLARLRASSSYFAFKLNEDEVEARLRRTAETHPTSRWLVRLLVAKHGTVTIEINGLPSEASARTRRVRLASFPVESTQPFLFHKTTNRSWYERALAEKGDYDDVILWNERGEITESTIANVVVSLDGKLVTPSRSAGLLAGTFREELLNQKIIIERTINKAELQVGSSFFLVNSVRKWMPVILT
jgi:para-aminobenzoate synthetase / 4-amino-4-deoxychorismate lyase